MILALWSKDTKHILCLEECSISDTPNQDESPRASLTREIFTFLDSNVSFNLFNLFTWLVIIDK